MFFSVATITAILAVVVGSRLPLRKVHRQFKTRIDRGYPIVRDSAHVEGELELEAYGLLNSPCQPPNSSDLIELGTSSE